MLYFSSKLRDFESTGLVLYPQNAGETDFTANGQIKFDLPSNTLVDLDSLHIDAKCFCDDAAASTVNRLPADIHKLIRRVEVTAGGQELGHAYNFYDRLKHGVDALTGKEPGPTSHPRLLRTGLDSAEGPTAFTAKALAKKAAIAAVEAAVPKLYSSTVEHLPLKAPLDGGAAGVTPADGSVNIIGRHSATKLSVCGYSADGYTKVMTETTFTWLQLAAALDVDGAQLVPLFEVLGFANYSTTQAMVDAIAAAQQAVLDTRSSRTVDNEGEAETNDVRFTFDSFGGFLQTVQPRMLDLSILPTISITLHLNTPECLVAAAGDEDPEDFLTELNADEVPSGFTVRDPRLYITAIDGSKSKSRIFFPLCALPRLFAHLTGKKIEKSNFSLDEERMWKAIAPYSPESINRLAYAHTSSISYSSRGSSSYPYIMRHTRSALRIMRMLCTTSRGSVSRVMVSITTFPSHGFITGFRLVRRPEHGCRAV